MVPYGSRVLALGQSWGLLVFLVDRGTPTHPAIVTRREMGMGHAAFKGHPTHILRQLDNSVPYVLSIHYEDETRCMGCPRP
jgi:hypothetical protein